MTASTKHRHPFRICLLVFVLALLGLWLVYYPHVFYRYLDTLPDAENCRIRVYSFGNMMQLDETQRGELLAQMGKLKCGFVYGPCTLSEENFGTPAEEAAYGIYIYSPDEPERQPFIVQTYDTSKTGIFYKSKIFPMAHWLTVRDVDEIYLWLRNLENSGTFSLS